jgi:small-conductance mechanosensitive channel
MASLVVPAIAALLAIAGGVVLWLPLFDRRGKDGPRSNWASAVASARVPLLALIIIVAIRLGMTEAVATWSEEHQAVWTRMSRILTTLALGASLFFLIEGVERVIRTRFDVSVSDNLKARTLHTQVGILSRTAQVIVVIIAGAIVLMSFEAARQFGASVLASAGIASLVLGLAARPILENLLAGVQIALTQPVRLDDVVVIEGEWGRVEEIASTYIVIRIWDDRRLVVPLKYFLDNPIENWTRTSSRLLGTVIIHCDYGVDPEGVRAELTRICASTDLWDGRVAVVQMVEAGERTVQLRALVSATSGPRLWDLRTIVRERLTRYLTASQPRSIPRVRAEVNEHRTPDRSEHQAGHAEASHNGSWSTSDGDPQQGSS